MNILIAPDKFKGTLTAAQVCDAVEAGLRQSRRNFAIRKFPLADGGDGTLDIFLHHLSGKRIEVDVHDPHMRKIKAAYALSHDGKTAFIEMARASGLVLLKEEERNPLKTTSYGTGELIRDALDCGVSEIVLGIGGSATNDAALGAAEALGFKCYNSENEPVVAMGETLSRIMRIDTMNAHPKLGQVKITAICDVTNPFYGEQGAAFIYAPQKGASHDEVQLLDKGLQQIASVFNKQFNCDVQRVKGSGAGGGFAGGAMTLLNASLKSGVNTVFEVTNFSDAVAWADVVITGEGKVDHQTFQGKVVDGVVRKARESGKKVHVVCGQCELTEVEWKAQGILALHSLSHLAGVDEALLNSRDIMERLVYSFSKSL